MDEGIIQPRRRPGDPRPGPDALIIMTPAELSFLARITCAKEVSVPDMWFSRVAPQAVMAMEKLVVLGVKRIWVLGWCGSLQPDLRIGHLLIPSGAVSAEGTSRHYPIGDRSPVSDAEMNRALEGELSRQKLFYAKGRVWSTDAPYRETSAQVLTHQRDGVLAVEMEMSALMTLALYRSVALAGVLIVSDELFDLKWRPGFSDPRLKSASRSAGEILLRLAGYGGS
jgi:uridine phosphorylase